MQIQKTITTAQRTATVTVGRNAEGGKSVMIGATGPNGTANYGRIADGQGNVNTLVAASNAHGDTFIRGTVKGADGSVSTVTGVSRK